MGTCKQQYSEQLDLSSFPLLRIDEVPYHDEKTLNASANSLHTLLVQEDMTCHAENKSSFVIFLKKLLDHINMELAKRRVNLLTKPMNTENEISCSSIPSNQHIISNGRKSLPTPTKWVGNKPRCPKTLNKVDSSFFMVRGDKTKNSFRSRAKSAHSSISAARYKQSDKFQEEQIEKLKFDRRMGALRRLNERSEMKKKQRCKSELNHSNKFCEKKKAEDIEKEYSNQHSDKSQKNKPFCSSDENESEVKGADEKSDKVASSESEATGMIPKIVLVDPINSEISASVMQNSLTSLSERSGCHRDHQVDSQNNDGTQCENCLKAQTLLISESSDEHCIESDVTYTTKIDSITEKSCDFSFRTEEKEKYDDKKSSETKSTLLGEKNTEKENHGGVNCFHLNEVVLSAPRIYDTETRDQQEDPKRKVREMKDFNKFEQSQKSQEIDAFTCEQKKKYGLIYDLNPSSSIPIQDSYESSLAGEKILLKSFESISSEESCFSNTRDVDEKNEIYEDEDGSLYAQFMKESLSDRKQINVEYTKNVDQYNDILQSELLKSKATDEDPIQNDFRELFPNLCYIFTEFYGPYISQRVLWSDDKNFKQNFGRYHELLKYHSKISLNFFTRINENNHGGKFNMKDSILLCKGKTKRTYDAQVNSRSKRYISGQRYIKIASQRQEVTGIISDVLLNDSENHVKWIELSDDVGLDNYWNLLWTWKKPKLKTDDLLVFQKINRFSNAKGLTRKDLLKKCLQRYCSKRETKIMPLTFILPQEYNAFVSAFSSLDKISGLGSSNIWIMKPVAMSRGRGISLINDIGKVSYSSPVVIQKYIISPLLFDGFKFDLRLYILVTSFSPLEAFIYREGFARFGTTKFSIKTGLLEDQQIHLTNSSIQKEYCEDIEINHPVRLAGSDGGGNKVKLTWLWKQLRKQGLDTAILWKRISNICLRTLMSVNNEIPFQPNSFEIFGFDVIIDEDLKPWLIEVNACPSLSQETSIDEIKKEMVKDSINLVDPPAFDRKSLIKVAKRLVDRNDSVVKSDNDENHHVPRDNNGVQQRGKIKAETKNEKDSLEKDLSDISYNQRPRQYGEMPRTEQLGQYERLAPGTKLSRKRIEKK